jgi:hypothetical protein
LRAIKDEIERLGAELVIVGNGSIEHARWFAEEQSLDSRAVFTNPDLSLYQLFRARRGLSRILHPGAFLSAFRALRKGFRQSGLKGDGLQLGGVFVIQSDGRVTYRRSSRYPGDHAEPNEIVEALRDTQAR